MFLTPSEWHSLTSGLAGLASYALALLVQIWLRRSYPGDIRRLAFLLALLLMIGGTAYLLAMHPAMPFLFEAIARLSIMSALACAMILLWRAVQHLRSQPLPDTAQLQRVIHQLEHEVAERKRAESELRQSQDQLRQLAAHQERVKEDERKRIAREIHDELGQTLMALRLDISMLQAQIDEFRPALAEKASLAMNHVDASIKAVRAIINNLRPSALDLGLFAAIEWQVKEFQRRTGIICSVVHDNCNIELDDNRATALFRILQESLTNVARHARATRVEVELRCDGNRLLMKVADNGVGLYPGCRRKPNSFGLLGIGERISTLGGEFSIETGPEPGTVLSFSIPIRQQASAA